MAVFFKPEQITQLTKFVVTLPAGQFLFKQNDKGNSMFIVVDGTVELVHKSGQFERVVGYLGPGEVVGEKAVCITEPYKRTMSAVAKSEVTLLEFDPQTLRQILQKMPDFALKLLSVVIERLDRANHLISILQTTHPVERFIQYIIWLSKNASKDPQGAAEITLTSQQAEGTVNVPVPVCEQILEELTAEKLLIKREGGFLLPNESSLQGFTPTLKERIAV